ncbi:MAG: efflux RND transporter periplasmic adaptor subunit [Pseudomonadota bacterium]
MGRFFSFLFGLIMRFAVLVGAVGAAVVLGGALIAARSNDAAVETQPRDVAVIVANETDSYVATRRFAGRLAPQQVSDLGFQLGGRIIELTVDEGDPVEKDAVLGRLDIDQLQNRRAELQAQRREARASLERADATLRRTEDLVDQGFATDQNLDDIRAERDGLVARIQQIDAALQASTKDLEDSELLAPFAGEIVRRYVDVGSVVQAGAPIMRLNEAGVLEARIGVPIRFRNRIAVGEEYELSAGSLQTLGRVVSIVSDVNTGTRTLTVILEVEDDPGFVARDLVRLALTETERETGIWVPAQALNESLRGLWSVFVVVPTEGDDGRLGRIVRKDVEILHIEEDRVYVRGALQEGDLIVRSGAFRFTPGQSVRIVDAV